MCGRYSFAPKPQQLEELFPEVELPAQLEISFNIAPTQLAYVVANNLPTTLQRMEWGLVPPWSADGKNSGKMINARAEGIEEKPSFRDSIQTKRCLVPADSFYEWQKEAGGKKAPYRIKFKNDALMAMAGIWAEWQQGRVVKRTFSIITTTPNREMAAMHDRMPVILADRSRQQQWLSGADLPAVLHLLTPLPDGSLALYRVSDRINKAGYDGRALHDPVPEPWRLF